MYTQESWRDQASRHHETFNDLLYRKLRGTPWWLISAAVHAVIVLILFQLPFALPPSASKSAVSASVVEEIPTVHEELTPPSPRESKPVRDNQTPLPDPRVTKDAVDPKNEDDTADPFNETLGAKDFLGESFLDGPETNPAIGIGDSAGGPFAGRGGLRKMRAGGRGGTEESLRRGLSWLANHQSEDGMWDCDGFSSRCSKLGVCDGPGNAMYDPGVSGLALLAFLGAGETHRHGQYRKNVEKGLRYLRQIQDPEGCFGPRTTSQFTYNTSIAALAMAEGYGMTGSPLLRRSAQQGIDFLHKAQNPYLAWRYGVRPGDNDTSVTGWMVMALKSARMAGLDVDQAAFDGAGQWVEKVTEPEYGRVGYTARGSGSARPSDLADRFPADRTESMTAVGLLIRIFLGEDPKESEMIKKGAALLQKSLPVWDEASGSIDMYYWYYGTLAMFQVDGEGWKQWNNAIKDAIVDHQRTDGDERGSWDPVGPWGREGGRVYSTALNTMCMEVYFRYPKVFGTGKGR